jgi:hypothetical protein
MTIEEPTPEPRPVPRAPGWYLVAARNAGPGWSHLLSSSGANGTVVTRCGIRGHVVPSDTRQITQCPECLAVAR